jgi:hypothetical protein
LWVCNQTTVLDFFFFGLCNQTIALDWQSIEAPFAR